VWLVINKKSITMHLNYTESLGGRRCLLSVNVPSSEKMCLSKMITELTVSTLVWRERPYDWREKTEKYAGAVKHLPPHSF